VHKKTLIAAAVAGALSMLAVVPAGAEIIDHRAAGLVAISGDPLLAIEAHRSGIIARLAAEHRAALAASGISEGSFRDALAAVRADQLLAASLVNTLDEVSRIIAAGPAETPANSSYVALTPTNTLAALPAADAYLVRNGEHLSVVKPGQLQLGATTELVGYFVAGTGNRLLAGGSAAFVAKDGTGSGPNSWIGYVAGNNLASGSGSAVAAGKFNNASGTNAFVGAGQSNVASGTSSLVIGGFDNRATAIDSLVGAGAGHRATGARSVIVGGGYNLASGNWSFVGGGGRQTADAAGAGGFVEDNVAGGNFSAVTGGQGNRAMGTYAAVPGGFGNLASGVSSFAAGNRAKTQTAGGSPTIHNGTFAFADSSPFDFNTTAGNEFAARATGGVRFITAIDGAGAATRTTFINTNGTVVAGGNFAMQATTPSVGAFYQSSQRLIHTFGVGNMFVGNLAGNFTLTGASNVGLGASSLLNLTSGTDNVALGRNSLSNNTSGSFNTAGGSSALGSNQTGQFNTAFGSGSLVFNVSGTGNTALGVNALAQNQTANNNTALGREALALNTTGFNAVASGYNALRSNTSGDSSVAYGTSALLNNTTGSNNTGIGTTALLANTTGNNNTSVGVNSNVAAGNLNNATALGANAVVDASNHVRIGDANVTQIGGQVAFSNLSDRREKKDIRDLSLGLDFVKALRPVEYRMRQGNDRIDFGFIAQDIEALVGTAYNVIGIGTTPERKLSLRYTDLLAPLVKAVQQQQAMIERQQGLIDEQRALIARQQADARVRDLEFAELRRSVETLRAAISKDERLAAAR
jgi:hypothetical protein